MKVYSSIGPNRPNRKTLETEGRLNEVQCRYPAYPDDKCCIELIIDPDFPTSGGKDKIRLMLSKVEFQKIFVAVATAIKEGS